MAKIITLVCAEEVTERVATDERTEDNYPVYVEQTRPCGELVDRVEVADHVEDAAPKLAKAIMAGKVKDRPETPCAAGHVGKVVEQ